MLFYVNFQLYGSTERANTALLLIIIPLVFIQTLRCKTSNKMTWRFFESFTSLKINHKKMIKTKLHNPLRMKGKTGFSLLRRQY